MGENLIHFLSSALPTQVATLISGISYFFFPVLCPFQGEIFLCTINVRKLNSAFLVITPLGLLLARRKGKCYRESSAVPPRGAKTQNFPGSNFLRAKTFQTKCAKPFLETNIKHRKNSECCPGHYLIVSHYSSMS